MFGPPQRRTEREAIFREKVAQRHNWQNLQLCSLAAETTFRGRNTPMQTATTLKGKAIHGTDKTITDYFRTPASLLDRDLRARQLQEVGVLWRLFRDAI